MACIRRYAARQRQQHLDRHLARHRHGRRDDRPAAHRLGERGREFIDGSGKLLASDTLAPYSANWNLRKAAKGAQTLTVRAVDSAGNVSQASVNVTVK